MEKRFWSRLDELIKTSEIVIDRPKGTTHSRNPDLVFPLDYGYLSGTTGGDDDGTDIWIGTAEHRQLTAIACTVDMKKRDAEIKPIIGCTKEEIGIIEKCHNSWFQSAIIVRRDKV